MKTLKEKMKATSCVALFITVLCIISLLSSCGDDDTGPSQTDLLVGTWELDEINGVSISSGFTAEITFERDGDYEEDINDNGQIARYTGEWEWNSDQDEITIDYDQNFADWELDVEELTADELEVDDGSDTYLLVKQ